MAALPPALTLKHTTPAKKTNQTNSFLHLQPCLSLLELCKYTAEFEQIHGKLTKLGLIHNPLALTRLICYSSISPHTDINYAQSIFNLDKNPNTFAYNVMIRGYAQKEDPEKALSLFNSMLLNELILPNELTFPFVLKACSQLKAVEEGKQVHGLVFKHGFREDLYVNNSLISMYSSCGLVNFARQVFDEIGEPDVVSWNSIIRGLVDLGLVEEGKLMFDRMPKRSLVTWNCLMDGCAKVGSMKEARELFDKMEQKDSVSWNTMITGYISLGLIEDARSFFDNMPQEMKDMRTFNSMIDGYARQSRYRELLETFREMQEVKVEPNRFTMVSVLMACSSLVAVEQGEWIHAYIKRNRVHVDAVLGTALVDMFAKCGNVEMALSVFETVEERDTGMWNSIIHGLGIHGYGGEALEIFADMLTANVWPDEITFIGLLNACRHSGLVNEGKRYFRIMSEEYGLKPKVEHYGCMVDLLCRADLLEEARDLIETSQIEASVPMWGALLGASSRLGKLAMGEFAAEHLLELDPSDCSCYVILSNMYSAGGMYEKAMNVRNRMRDQGLEKVPGSSSVEIDGLINEFRVFDYLAYQ